MATDYDDYGQDAYDNYEGSVIDEAFERNAEDAYEDDLGAEDPDLEFPDEEDDEADLRRAEGLMPWATPEGVEPGQFPRRAYDDDEIPF
ncbi:hypothetical protein CcrC1_gp523 [Caulobacter phage C1]|nr:hypothetical protein CcrC1_gp030 [Caulobacter phage C1]UTU08257.1 hypothetical protein CcrC2_gp029 [Caulobacter phage C2]UTU08780.1 hypothetical protein CcrJ4_gp029 [Caulobacter phage J4]UTU09318.1 hypothetical protein CcrBL47_gp032 [Caulobacter phage BL47]UTU09892.1 hypothetical protein CcrRB23_gp030 [Caulobacter phage RB23]WGN96916.1 hypothetical protein [Bertelyvirus sp.]